MEATTAQLVVTCLVDSLAPRVGKAVVAVLEGQGVVVEVPNGQTCCGQPAFNIGLLDDARSMAGHTLDVLDATEGPVVVPSGSCTAMIVSHYRHMFRGTDREEQAERVASRTRELTQYLVDDLGADVRAGCGGCSVVYHHSCHGLRELGIRSQPDHLLREVDRRALDDEEACCGFGGLFSLEMPAVSTAIMNSKLDAVEASGAEVLVGGDISCLLHMEGGLRRRGSKVEVRHIAEMMGDGVDR
jgi:L-lactate dehydrogenase complex protein LldE